MSENGDFSPLACSLLRLPHVQFWETENAWRLDRSHRGGYGRDIPSLVDASSVRIVNALKAPPARSMSEMGILQQLSAVPVFSVSSQELSSTNRPGWQGFWHGIERQEQRL